MQTIDKATTKQRTQWQDSKAQHALTAALVKKGGSENYLSIPGFLQVCGHPVWLLLLLVT